MFVISLQSGKSSEMNLTLTMMYSSPDNYPMLLTFLVGLFNAKKKQKLLLGMQSVVYNV